MKRALYFVPGFLLFASLPALGATVETVKGEVMINRGEGFKPASNGVQAKAGDLLMANAGGRAKLTYPGGCQINILPGRVVSVAKKPPCTAASLVGEDATGRDVNPVVPFAIGAAIGWGIFCATVYCRDHGGGGRQLAQPASP
jgi:hypothetical protein